jgi:2-oxoisovalerate dehydrogenase E1 component alpha subunit
MRSTDQNPDIRGLDAAPLSADLLTRSYRLVSLTRAVDERLWVLSRQGRAGFVLTARGHEVAQVASALALRVGSDTAWLYYRDLGVGLTLGVTPYEIFLGALAKAGDPHSGGRQLTAHFSSRELRIGSISSAVGAHIPHAVGAAYAARVLGHDSVAVCWFGDGASSEGAAHEAMNIAAVHRLPVVFICENNGYAISVPESMQMAAPVAARAAGYGMPGATLDGTDADAVYQAAVAVVDRARSGHGPSLLELRVPRLVPHSSQDDDKYRSDAERGEAAARDPLARLRARLVDDGVMDDDELDREDAALREQVRADAERALEAPDPEPARARRWLYAGDDR